MTDSGVEKSRPIRPSLQDDGGDDDFGLEFTDSDSEWKQRHLIDNEHVEEILGKRPPAAEPRPVGEVATLLWAIDAFAWWAKRAVVELTDGFVCHLPVVRVDTLSTRTKLAEVNAVTVGDEIVINSDLDPISAARALFEHVVDIHIPTKGADPLYWAMQR